jgi:hypothetical protein
MATIVHPAPLVKNFASAGCRLCGRAERRCGWTVSASTRAYRRLREGVVLDHELKSDYQRWLHEHDKDHDDYDGHPERRPKRLMNAMFLKELADKTRRGLSGRVELGKAGGGLCFGYRIVRTFKDGVVSTGEREIVPEEAEVIRRIFRDYVAGISPKQIAKDLNREGQRGPRAALWGPSTIYGNPKRGSGILHNELYIGRLEQAALPEGSGHR